MATARDVFRSKAFLVGIAQSVLWIALSAALMYHVSSFERVFKDFGYGELPVVTAVVLKLGHLLVQYWYVGLLPISLWPFAYWGVTQHLRSAPISQDLWHITTWGVPFVCAGMVVFALVRPLIVLITKVQG